MKRKRLVIGAVVVAAVAAGGVVAVRFAGNPLAGAESATDDTSAEASASDSRDELDSVGIQRGDLTSTSDFTGELGYGESWPLSLTAQGIITGARDVGSVVEFGKSLIEVDDRRVFLVEGDVPMFRDLELTSPRIGGGDVAQLQRFLIAQGFDRDGKLVANGVFDSTTRKAVIDWQEATWQPNTGRITSADMVFSPEPLRIANEQRVGSVFDQLEVTAAEPTVTVDVANRDKQLLTVGTPVTIEFGDGSQVDGSVLEQVSVPQDDGTTKTRATIEPHGDVPGETGQVTISVDATLASDVMIVPVGALLALAEGGYAVEVVDGGGATHLVGVDVGEILDGKAEVSGNVDVGESVLVAR